MCMIWINQPSVIIGKHQNAYAEINYPYVKRNNIPVIRRISGGGAVYHDTGNVNFSFIRLSGKNNQVDFNRFTGVIIEFLQSQGIVANTNARNSLLVGESKFSGHAEHVFRNKVLHHGTMLFNTDLQVLQSSITPVKEFKGKALASVRSKVANLAPLLPLLTDIQQFIKVFTEWLMVFYHQSHPYYLTVEDEAAIQKLAEEKYRTWQWNFGYSPAYSFEISMDATPEPVTALLKVENGAFTGFEIKTVHENQFLEELLHNLKGILHKEDEIDNFIEKNQHLLELAAVNAVTLRESFFR